MMFYWFLKILLAYDKALWSKKLEISHANQILTNECQILVLSWLSNYYCNASKGCLRPKKLKFHTWVPMCHFGNFSISPKWYLLNQLWRGMKQNGVFKVCCTSLSCLRRARHIRYQDHRNVKTIGGDKTLRWA